MHVRESKLWALAQKITRFMGGWGFCHGGQRRIEEQDERIIRGWGFEARPLDQCNVRGWIITDLFVIFFSCLCMFAATLGIGMWTISPMLDWIIGLQWTSPPDLSFLGVVLLHALLCLWMVTERCPPIVRWYMMTWARGLSWLARKFYAVWERVKSVPKAAVSSIRPRGVFRQALKELKSNMCEIYDHVTPELKTQRVVRLIEGKLEETRRTDSYTFILVHVEGETWADQVKTKVLAIFRARLNHLQVLDEPIDDYDIDEMCTKLASRIQPITSDMLERTLWANKQIKPDDHLMYVVDSTGVPHADHEDIARLIDYHQVM